MKYILPVLIALCSLLHFSASASVVMTNTRIIYPAGEKSKTIQFTNRSDIPYLMQLWTDVNNPSSSPDNADGPFIVSPVIFRMEPKSGQSARLSFIGENLPQDRESLFYLNFSQIPPKNSGGQSNKLLLILKSRVKIFYRPETIQGNPAELTKNLAFELRQLKGVNQLHIKNSSGFYASFASAEIKVKDKFYPVDVDMVAPKSEQTITLKDIPSGQAGSFTLRYTLINDLGAKKVNEILI
jgi:fimbrial chaperone protein